VSSATRLAPVAVSGSLSFETVSAGNNFSCGVTTAGAGYCWGTGMNGRLGTGSFGDDSTPAPVTGGLTFAMITTGKDVEFQPVGNGFACGLTTGGAAYCWGNNSHGELGDSGSSSHSAPVPVARGLTFAALSAGQQHVCGVTTSGAAYCWGNGTSGQLGNGSASASNVPVPVSGSLVFSTIAAGGAHTCGVTTEGDAYCWGGNLLGQLGTGVFAPDFSPPQTTPVAVIGGLKFETLAAGAAHTCGLSTLGVIYCWGRGFDGQLGNASLSNKAVPTPVLVP
jgi:alpha-tubulin suppressor-like RCC1 family protein